MTGKKFYSVKEVAQILNLSTDRIYEYLRTGRLHGSRITEHSAWRIPAAELQRLTGSGLGKTETQTELRLGKWSEYLDIVVQLQNSLSRIGPKDWSIWGLPDSGQPPLTSEAGLRTWMDRGKLIVKLAVEQDNRFLFFINRLKTSLSDCKSYEQWRQSLTDFIQSCYAVTHEIWSEAERETGLNLSAGPIMGKGHFLNVPKFIYEFVLDNYASGKQPDLEILQDDLHHYRLVPRGFPNYILAIGSEDEIEWCREVTISLIDHYTKDQRIGQINDKALQVKKQAATLQAVLSGVITAATGEG